MDKTFLTKVAAPRGIALAVAAQCFIAGSAAAQLDGVVTRAGGSPLEGVSVEAWSVDRRVGATLTDVLGTFSFSEEIASTTVRLRLGALGFELQEVAVRDGRISYEIELTEAPLAVEGLVVTMEEATCEMGREDAEGRRLWQLARIRYDGLMDTLGIATYLAEADTIVPLSQARLAAASRAQPEPERIVLTATLQLDTAHRQGRIRLRGPANRRREALRLVGISSARGRLRSPLRG